MFVDFLMIGSDDQWILPKLVPYTW